MIKLRCTLVFAASLGLSAAALGQGPSAVPTVRLAPALQAALESTYGRPEQAVLEQTIAERVAAALKSGCDGVGTIEITLLDARPTHPTDKQIMDNPSLDRLRYDWDASDDHHGSRAAEPWGDVRLASEGLGSQLVHECRAVAPHAQAS